MERGAPQLVEVCRRFMAVTSPGGNALRNQEPGVVGALQEELVGIALGPVPTGSAGRYLAWLDATTDLLVEKVAARPHITGRPWGTVRKALNLYMRSCICDVTLREHFGLHRIEPWAESPLDSLVAAALKQRAGRGLLPSWPGLKHLRPTESEQFQGCAERWRLELGLPGRIYLDYYLWLGLHKETLDAHGETLAAFPPE